MPEHIKLSEANDAVALSKLAMQALLEAKNSKTSASGSKFISDGQEDENGVPLGTGTILNGVSGGVQQWVNDTTAPGTPTGLSISSSSGSVFITWTGTLDGGVPPDFDHITVNATDGNKQFVAGSMTNSGTIAIADLTAGDTITVTAVAYDDAHDEDGNSRPNASQPSTPISVKVVSAVDQSVIDKINADLADNKKILDQASKDIEANKTSIDQTGKDLSQAKNDLAAATSTIDGINANVTSIGNDVSTMKPDVAQAKEDIDKAKTDIGNVTVTVTTISDDVSKVKTDVAGNTTAIGSANSSIAAANDSIANAKQDIAAAKTDIASAKNDITATNNKVTQAQQTADNALTTANNAKNITWSVEVPTTSTPGKNGDLWYQVNSTGTDIISFWRYGNENGTGLHWSTAPITDSVITNLDAGKINTGTLAAGRIAAGSITGNKIAANSITAGHIVANSITSDKLVSNAVTAGKIAANAIGAGNIVSGAITAAKLAANSVNANNIVTGAVTGDKIAANAVTAVNIAAGSINADKINAGSVAAALVSSGRFTTPDGSTGFDSANGFWIKNSRGDKLFQAYQGGIKMQGYIQTASSSDARFEIKQGSVITPPNAAAPGSDRASGSINFYGHDKPSQAVGGIFAMRGTSNPGLYIGQAQENGALPLAQLELTGVTSTQGTRKAAQLTADDIAIGQAGGPVTAPHINITAGGGGNNESMILQSGNASVNIAGYVQINSGTGHAVWINNNSGQDVRIGTSAHPVQHRYYNDIDYNGTGRELFAYYNNWHGAYSANSQNGKYVSEYSASVHITSTGWYRVEIGQCCNGEAVLLFSLHTSNGSRVVEIPVNGVNGPSTNNKVTNSKTIHLNKGMYTGIVYYTWWGGSASITGSGSAGTQFRDQQHGLYSRYCSLIAD